MVKQTQTTFAMTLLNPTKNLQSELKSEIHIHKPKNTKRTLNVLHEGFDQDLHKCLQNKNLLNKSI